MLKKISIKNLFLMVSFISAMTNGSTEIAGKPDNIKTMSKQLDVYMDALTKLNRFSGTVIVTKGNEILLNKGYGFASLEFEVPNTEHTLFRICSITKMVTAAALMQLQERGLLNVHDVVNKYIPDFPRGNEITIHQLLSHTSGVSSENFPLEMVVQPAHFDQIISFIKSKPLEYDPGSDYRYSNGGYYVLSHIIEKVSGKTYESFVKENILVPSGMKESFFREQEYAILKNCAVGYCLNEKNEIVNGHYIYENFKGGGGLFCTALDLYKFARSLNALALINQKSLKAMVTPYHHQENYGYGCHIQELMKKRYIEHGGMLSSGFKSNVTIFIDDEIYIVLLSNLFSSWVNEARNSLAAIVLGLPYDIPSLQVIKLSSDAYNDYVGLYDHPAFKLGYKIERKGDSLYLPDNIELSAVAKDQFMTLNRNANNVVYRFARDETGLIIQLRIIGGAPYFEIRCDKIR